MRRIHLSLILSISFLFLPVLSRGQASKIIGTLAEDHFTKYSPIPGNKYVGSGWIKRNDSLFAALILVKKQFEPEKVWASNMLQASSPKFQGILPQAFSNGFLAFGEGRNNQSIISRFDYQLNQVWQKSVVSPNDGFHHAWALNQNLFAATSLSDLINGRAVFFVFDSSGSFRSQFHYQARPNAELVLRNVVSAGNSVYGYGSIAGLRDSSLIIKIVDSTLVGARKIAINGLPNVTLKLGALYRDSLYFFGIASPLAGSASAEIIIKSDTNLNISWVRGRNAQTTAIRNLYPSPDGKLYAISSRFDPPNIMLSKITPSGDMVDRRAGGRSGFSLLLDGEILNEFSDSLVSVFSCRYLTANRRNTLVHYCQKSGISDCNTVFSTVPTTDYGYVVTPTQLQKVRLPIVQSDQTNQTTDFTTEQNINTCLPTRISPEKGPEQDISIFPNPIENSFQVHNPDNTYHEITWVDAMGKNLGTFSLQNGGNQLTKPANAHGLVFLVFNGRFVTKPVKIWCR